MTPQTKANLILLLITAIWGATFPLIHEAMLSINPYLFVALRFTLAALVLIPILGSSLKGEIKPFLGGCFFLGFINSIIYFTQSLGLQTVDSARAAFIIGLSVILTTLFAPLFKLGRLRLIDLSCSLLCLLGLYILTGSNFKALTVGDWWLILSAVLISIYLNYFQCLTLKHRNYGGISFYIILFSIPLPALLALKAPLYALFTKSALLTLLFCAVIATSFVFYFQAKYQQQTSSTKAVLIYSLEPVFASLLGCLCYGETLTRELILGGSIILASLILPALLPLFFKPKTAEAAG